MGKNTHLEQDTIAQIIALKESGMQTKYIVSQLGVSGRSVRRWVAKFNQRGGKDTPTYERDVSQLSRVVFLYFSCCQTRIIL